MAKDAAPRELRASTAQPGAARPVTSHDTPFDFSAETHAKNLPDEGWHYAIVRDPRVSESEEATWVALPLTLEGGQRVDELVCVSADPNGKFASRVNEGRQRVNTYLVAGDCTTTFDSATGLESALDGAEVEVLIRWRNPDFPVPTVRDVRKPMQRPQDPERGPATAPSDA